MTSVDAVIAGGGIMGCATALRLADGGMRVALIERGALCMGASGVNAGTLSIQIKLPALVPYALRGLDRWQAMSMRLGCDVGFHRRGGVTLAFTDAEAEMLCRDTERRRQAGATIDILSAEQAHRLDPGLTPHARLASHCPDDAYANASRTGVAYRGQLRRVGVDLREHTPLDRITGHDGRYEVHAGDQILSTPRVVLATGAWLRRTAGLMGIDLPVQYKVNQVSVTERYPRIVRAIVSHARALLTLKQSDNGTVLIGGGWPGGGDLESGRTSVTTSNLVGNLRLAQLSVPALARARLVRTWHGFEAYVADQLPLAGALPGRAGAYVLGCVRGGWTIGPYVGELLADHLLGRALELPLFDPARFGSLDSASDEAGVMSDRTPPAVRDPARGGPRRIDTVSRGQAIAITVDGQAIEAFLGESVATALLAAGSQTLRSSPRQQAPRSLFCAMGVCQECAVWIDDRSVTACMTPVRPGMRIATKGSGHED